MILQRTAEGTGAVGMIEFHKMHTTDTLVMSLSNFELRDRLLNVISYTV
jgi:hypothetical protein